VFVEHEITFGDQTVRIRQRVETDSAGFFGQEPANQTILRSSYVEDRQSKQAAKSAGTGGGPGDPAHVGGFTAGYGSGPVTLIGPFVLMCPCHNCQKPKKTKQPDQEK
jgi:hypothetical protein